MKKDLIGKLKKPSESELAPPGYHIVHTHLRRNRGKAAEFLKENLLHQFWNNKKKFDPLKKIKEFENNDNGELDRVIQFWLDYWKAQGLKGPEIDPLVIKALIAIESSFNPTAATKVEGSSAYGLMQITDQARQIMSGNADRRGYKELRSEKIVVSRDDLSDPVTNIATGTRWLFHKYSKRPKVAEKNVFNMVKNYNSWDNGGEDYAKSVMKLYEKSK